MRELKKYYAFLIIKYVIKNILLFLEKITR